MKRHSEIICQNEHKYCEWRYIQMQMQMKKCEKFDWNEFPGEAILLLNG